MKPTFFEDYARNLSRIMMAEFIDRLRADSAPARRASINCSHHISTRTLDEILPKVPELDRPPFN
jgi:hypothetical protein